MYCKIIASYLYALLMMRTFKLGTIILYLYNEIQTDKVPTRILNNFKLMTKQNYYKYAWLYTSNISGGGKIKESEGNSLHITFF